MIINETATHIYWPINIGDGYDFVANKRYKIHRMGDIAMIFNPDEIRLDDNEITIDVMRLAVFE